MKRILMISAAVVVLLAVAGYFLLIKAGAKKYEFRFEKVSKGDVTVYVTATGTINAVTQVEVGTQVSGIISKLYADFNSIVKEGDVIAQIDPTFLKQAVRESEANLERARAQAAESKRNYERTKTMYEKQLESQLNYDAALTSYESDQAALKQAEASLDRAKINLAYATIYAPINGVVIDRKVNVGQTVAASFSSPTLYSIANDLRKMQVQTTVDESDIGRVSIGQEATFTVDAYPDEKFSGAVSQIRLAPTSIQNVVNYIVIIDFDNSQLKLMPGMTANVKILVGSDQDVLRVPNMALRFQPPADLVDSTKAQERREAMFSDDQTGSPGGRRQSAEIQKLRDSILAAHGEEMSREEIRAEMRKVLGSRRMSPGTSQPASPTYQRSRNNTRFGVTQRFPEYQKSAYVAAHESGFARLWILNAQGKLEPVFVRTGMNDGRYTSVTSSTLQPGDQIVVGVQSNSDGVEQVRSPFTTQTGPGGRGFGGGPR